MQNLTAYQAKFYAHELDRSYASDHVGRLAGLLFDAQVEPKPHQVDAALFALQTPFTKGVILADEVGLGKTIEAGIVISQYWAQRQRRILIIAPSSLRQQWQQELSEKFALPATLMDRKNIDELVSPSGRDEILICSYEFANSQTQRLIRSWDLVVCDEAHRLRSNWTGQAKIAGNVARICQAAGKTVMLTATPLQNRLEELYGLVSVFSPDYFHTLDSFRERYLNHPEGPGNDDLVDRVSWIAKRTLRKDADKYIRFTQRIPLTVAFTPSPAEIQLYDQINEYLQRPFLHAFAKSQRHLSALILRKRLGSSSFAVATTLEKIANRLEIEMTAGRRRNDAGNLMDDPDLTDEIREASEANTDTSPAQLNFTDRQEILDEVNELRNFAALARSITVNQKAVKLIDALEQGFSKLREIGAPEKAIIFTDSTVTQDYLARSLSEAGWGEGLILFNGSNDSPEAKRIYNEWLEENKDGDLVTGIAAADRRKALVDEFRDRGRIMIATEAAAEGINLQFCSMLVNYDLPWNPQRIEQRIGRVHRFGQKHNVIVVNFSNKGNRAEERILELLTEKFQLFTSVFGASDEVLGQIEDGLDFEKMIAGILDNCKTATEIDAAFKELEERYSKQINREMKKTRAKVFDNLDPKVRDKLKYYDAQTVVLNAFQRLLIQVTHHELEGKATFNSSGTQFTLHEAPLVGIPIGDYYFKSEPRKGAHQYRYTSDLCAWVIEHAKNHDTPPAHLTFQIKGSEHATTVAKRLKKKSGRLRIEEATFTMKAGKQQLRESYLLTAGFFDDGTPMDHEQIRDLLDLNCTTIIAQPVDGTGFEDDLNAQLAELGQDVEDRNAGFFLQQEELIEASRLDHKAKFDAKIREYQAKETTAKKAARKATSATEELKLKQEARQWRRKIDDAEDKYRTERNRLRNESEEYLDNARDALNATENRRELFTITWEVN